MAHQDNGTLPVDEHDYDLGAPRELPTRSAYDLKDVHDRLRDLPDNELKQIPVLATRTRLNGGSMYLDLQDLERGEFKASNSMEAEHDNAYVAKHDVDYELWNYLTGETDTYRLGRFINEARPADKPLT
jgi:hypothetical protein